MENYSVKLIDFGSAFEFPEKSPIAYIGYTAGTPAYLAPECWKGLYSPATDMWAFGVLLCYLLFLQPPYFDPQCDNDCKAAISGMSFTPDKGENVHLKKLY
jgi:serine/threonine protein kinase